MRAVVCRELGPPESLTVGELEPAPLNKNEVRIAVHACGVNFPDTLIIQGKYQFKPDLPFAPGSEVAGEIIEVGESVSNCKVGDRVMALTGWGGYAESVTIGAERVLPLPPGMDYVTAAGFPMTYGTSMHALVQRGRLQEGETLLVLGAAGGVGLAAVELGKALGARVIAAASSADKLAIAKEHGADEVINYQEENLKERVKELTDGKGADVIYDPVGGDAFDAAMRAINWKGRLLVVGFASGRIPELPVNLALLKGCEVVGVFWGSFVGREPEKNAENFKRLFGYYAQGKIKPHVCATYPLEDAPKALNDMLQRKAVGKIVITTGRD
ncbi:NADPH:quinone oxidoreductase [Alkalilimnicola ehrlichii]|uniref:NADPH:quinone oxidoreductase n=1 Tax=Alkalilimnicola ehrlichii TaxID=351052 RepID=A0A3E0WIL1_9GAMM|nr:NADPH:quinone oxidoreductase family protein [Alkalilimnicola ehrlichii]RFA26186.1 NADPH:quinone oxidoreductase [Alkalilimnicola ehrlichii]RFA31705.1 NADPH:quinone oxidoreductase [Alkalilimnicola ehrlichii]